MSSQALLDLHRQFVLQTYAGTDLVLVRGEGPHVWDADGRQYLDFTSGITVCSLGHCHPRVTQAIQRQAATLVHVSNLFVNDQAVRLAALISQRSFNGRVFFCNSGAEANEGLLKFARKWGSTRGGRYEVICMEHGFHGRTIATLAATDKPAIREGFGPLPPGFVFVPYNDLAAVDRAITEKTGAVLTECVQGEGGVRPAERDFLQGLRGLCDKHDLLLLFDEVQTGIGRTGELFAFQHYDVTPDAMSLAKALGNGFPLGAVVIARQWEAVLGVGSHATTFGGTALACAAGLATLEAIEADHVLANTRAMGAYLADGLLGLAKRHPGVIREVRGLGLMLGLQLASDEQVKAVIANARRHGLLLLSAAGAVVRVYPPLTITQAQVDDGLARLATALGELP